MMNRREFMETMAAGGAAMALAPKDVFGGMRKTDATHFGVHPFVESNPSAVFIMRTTVDVKTDSSAVRQAGMDFGTSVFVPMDSAGVPVTNRVVIKPNIVMMPMVDERCLGIVTDPYFVEGVIESIKLLGLSGDQFYLKEVNSPSQFSNSGYTQMAARTGSNLKDQSAPIGTIAPEEVVWKDVPNGLWFNKIPYLWPVHAPDTWLLNIAKFKTHLMGMSLCAKNMQGSIAAPYVEHCQKIDANWAISPQHVQPNAKADLTANYNRHLAESVPRWDRPGEEGGIWMETWATRCLDNNSITKPGLHVIEGVYGREGPFWYGPDPDGYGIDYMTNMVIFGKNAFHVDNIGHWLGGHESGNFGLFHMAIERNLASILDPSKIPLFEWRADGSAVPATLDDFQRWSLRTQYLRRDYTGQSEAEWHLVNEPYQYTTTGIASVGEAIPRELILRQNFPNPFNPSTSIGFSVPRSGTVRLEVFNTSGQIVDVLVDGYLPAGSHLKRWDGSRCASGVYFYRLRADGANAVKGMLLLR
jgi:uncharacterized protein (DUF362 family)